jgi:hypothetical protein
MPITQQQAAQWAGSATADQLTAIRSLRPDGRIPAGMVRHMVSISTQVVHCFVAGRAQPPILSLPDADGGASQWCQQLLQRDAVKRQTMDGDHPTRTGLAHTSSLADPILLKTFGHRGDITHRNPRIPFLRVSRTVFCVSRINGIIICHLHSSYLSQRFVRASSTGPGSTLIAELFADSVWGSLQPTSCTILSRRQ